MKWKLILGILQLSQVFTDAFVGPNLNPLDDKGQIKVEVRNPFVNFEFSSINEAAPNVLRTSLYIDVPGANPAQQKVESCGTDRICVKNGTEIHTEVDKRTGLIKISHSIRNPKAKIILCVDFGEGVQWYGGPQMRYQHWPIQKMYFEEEPYLPTHPTNMAITERYWLSSEGNYIYVEDNVPLFLDQNNYKDNHLCLIAQNKNPYPERSNVSLIYEIGTKFDNPRIAHETVVDHHFRYPTNIPDEKMIQHPIWSTWAKYKVHVNQTTVTQFAQEIRSKGFVNNSQLEIDDNWETCYGSAQFDTKKFPDIAGLTKTLSSLNFRTTLWIHPFINENCNPAYNDAKNAGYFVKDIKNNVSMSWWQGSKAATIDFTNPKAVEWWIKRLKELEKKGINSFKFDAGEVSWLPRPSVLKGKDELKPGIFTTEYVTTLAKNFNNIIEARVGWRTQTLPIFIRMIDKDTKWTWNNGLPTLITTLIQMNLSGYVFVLPDMIGGNGYVGTSFEETALPTKELFIRWLQANVFMPALQYSFVPWQYDAETIAISKIMTSLHEKISPLIVKAMKNAVKTGAPVNPPIWWIDPKNKVAHKINDEFLLGEDVLVAPVIVEGATSRDIYLPKGTWRDGNTNRTHLGPIWVKNYPAPLNILPYFYKL